MWSWIGYLHIGHFHSSVLDVYYLHLWKHYVVFVQTTGSLYYRYNLSRTQLWDCWGISHCLLSHYSARCLLLTLMKHYNVFTQMKSSLYFRYNLSRTQLWDCWGIFTMLLIFFSARCLLLTLMKALQCIYADEKFTLL